VTDHNIRDDPRREHRAKSSKECSKPSGVPRYSHEKEHAEAENEVMPDIRHAVRVAEKCNGYGLDEIEYLVHDVVRSIAGDDKCREGRHTAKNIGNPLRHINASFLRCLGKWLEAFARDIITRVECVVFVERLHKKEDEREKNYHHRNQISPTLRKHPIDRICRGCGAHFVQAFARTLSGLCGLVAFCRSRAIRCHAFFEFGASKRKSIPEGSNGILPERRVSRKPERNATYRG
jgi:hypothetical protein